MAATDTARYRAAERRLWASLGRDPTERSLWIARLGITVRVQEVGDGPPVLFIHGANTSGASWAGLAARLDGFRCILLDRPGTGLSDTLVGHIDAARLPAFAEALVLDLLDALGLGTADLVGASFGGYVALRAAAAHPERVGRVVLVGWPAGTPADPLPRFMWAMTLPVLGRLAAALPPTGWTVRESFRWIGHGPSLAADRITPEDLDCYLALLRDTDTRRSELALGRALVSPVGGLDRILLPDALLASIAAPTLLVWGSNDPFGGEATARRLATRLPTATLDLLDGAGHAPWLDAPDRVAGAISAFLDR